MNQLVVQKLLERIGFATDSVFTVDDGHSVLSTLAEQNYDLLLLDIQMPTMDGFETARTIRLLEKGAHKRLPIVALTAHAMDGDAELCFAAGMDDYLTKPINMKRLTEALQRWLPAARNSPNEESTLRDETVTVVDTAVLNDYNGGELELQNIILAKFLEVTPPMLARLSKSLDIEDCDSVEHWAHTLKGTRRVVGSIRFGDLCQAIEELGRTRDLKGDGPLFIGLEEQWNQVEAEVRTLLKGV